MAEPVGAKVVTEDGRVYTGNIVEPASPGLLTLERCALVIPGGGWCSEGKRSIPIHNVRHVDHGEFTWGMGAKSWFKDGKPIIDPILT